MTLQYGEDPFGARFPGRKPGENGLTVAPTQQKKQLVSEKSSNKRAGNDPFQGEVAKMRSQSTKDQDRFAFKEGTHQHRGIAVVLYNLSDSHRRMIIQVFDAISAADVAT